jgi:transcriptional regulator with GAF, ATPase, and Fis domain
MSAESSTQGTLERAVLMATAMVPGCDAAGISILHRDSIDTPVASSEALRKVDELQHQIKQGPCFDALRDTETVTSVDLDTDRRWPEWGPRVTSELGFHSTLSFMLFTDGESRGALTLYSREVNGFTHDDIEDGLALAAHIAVAFTAADHADQLLAGLASRTVIGQATGILMERFGLDPAAAFAVLVRISQHSNTKIIDLATELVRTGRMEELRN